VEQRVNPREYIRAVRRRWFDVVLAVAVAVGAGYLVSSVAPPGPASRSYDATSVLLVSGNQYATGAPSVGALAELTTVGVVPDRVANQLGTSEDGAQLAAGVRSQADSSAGILKVTATATQPQRAQLLANAFARELVAYVRDLQAKAVAQQTGPVQHRLDVLQADIDQLDGQIAGAGPLQRSELQAKRDALVRQYGLAYESYQQLATSSTQPLRLSLIPATGAREISAGGIEPPRSRTSRMILAGILGVVIGIILVLILDRFDGRIRTRQVAERAFGRPVLAEIPAVSRRSRRRRLVLQSAPRSVAADAFRTLALQLSMPALAPTAAGAGTASASSVIGNGSPAPANGDTEQTGNGAAGPPKTVLVVSAGPGDGKTTVAANLAAAFANRGRRCLVLSCDFRRPKIHRLLGCANERGLSEALQDDAKQPVLRSYVEAAADVDGVWLVPCGRPPADPGELLASPRMRAAIEEAKRVVDVVVIDTAPLLTTSDAADLLPMSEAVVVVARAGRTTTEIAERTMELATRLGARVSGIVLNAVTEMSVPRRYYYYRYYRRPRDERPAKTRRKGKPQLVGHSSRE
jgi:capsular exopolysaccharide synthesis family protein